MVLPLSNDIRLQKTLLLRNIRSEVSHGSLTEGVLQSLEIIDELDRVEGISITDKMKRAYCAVAVSCTVKYLDDNDGLYLDAVRRIWRGKVRLMEKAASAGRRTKLLTDELTQWRDLIEAAVQDSKARARLGKVCVNDALNKVWDYLEETWASMGPSFLELAASLSDSPSGVRNVGDCDFDLVEPLNMSEEMLQSSTNASEGSDDEQLEEEVVSFVDGNGLAGIDVPPKGERGSFFQVEDCDSALAAEPLNMSTEMLHSSTNAREGSDNEQLEEEAVSSVDGDLGLGGIDSPPKEEREIQKGEWLLKQPASCSQHSGVKIAGAEEVGLETLCSKCDVVPKPEVEQVQESLKSSSLELQAFVKDPLPDILHKSDQVRSDLAMEGINQEPPLENQSRDVDVPDSNACKSIVLYQPIDTYSKKKCFVHQRNIHFPNLMERNSTAHVYEWDDSIDNLPEGVTIKRRKPTKWSSLEEGTLWAGVERFGKGKWKSILNFYSEIFGKTGRTEVDLKDKWRNMTH